MRNAQFVPLLLALLLMILQQSELRIIYGNGIKLRVSLTIFAINFSENSDTSLSFSKTLRAATYLPLILKSSKYLFKRADVRVYKISRALKSNVADALFVSLPLFISTASLLAYLRSNALSVRVLQNDDIAPTENLEIDIAFKTRVIDLIISSLIFLYYVLKRKIRRAVKSV